MKLTPPTNCSYNGKLAKAGEPCEVLPRDVEALKAAGWTAVAEKPKKPKQAGRRRTKSEE